MKRFKLLFILIVLIIAVMMPLEVSAYKEKDEEKEQCDVKVISKKVEGSDKYMSWKLDIPVVQGLKSKEIENQINMELEKPVISLKKELHLEAKKAYKESKKIKISFQAF